MLASTASNSSGRSSAPLRRLPTNLLAPRTCCDHGHGAGGEETDDHHDHDGEPDSLLPARIDRLALDNDIVDEYRDSNQAASPLTGTQFFSSLLLPSIVRLPPIPAAVDPPTASDQVFDLQPYWALFKQVQSIRSMLNQHVIDRAFHTYAHDRPAYHAEFQQVVAQAMSTLGTVHGLLRGAGLLPPTGRQASAPASAHVSEEWDQLCQHVGRVQELERERMTVTAKWQELVAESLHGTRDVQQEADQVKRLRDVVVEKINDALEEAQAWYAELAA
ncbi:hypothetical protein BCR44DRAFT_34271, partial [Catenaria anguillulae PL171]